MRNLFDGPERGVFRGDDGDHVLLHDFLPDELPHRENEMHVVADCVSPLISGGRPVHVFLHGAPGIGKTAVTRTVLTHMSDQTSRVKVLYLNCWSKNTRHGVLVELLTALGEIVPRQGLSTDEVYDRLLYRLDRKADGYVIALDEVDRLAGKEGDVLYDLLRSEVNLGLILISNDPYAFRNFDARVRSSLSYEEVSFAAYGYDELKDILGERARMAFLPGACDPAIVGVVARFTADSGGDVRLGLDCLLKAGREAERAGTARVGADQVKAVLSRVRSARLKLDLQVITDEERAILRTVLTLTEQDTSPVTTGAVFDAYKEQGGVVAERTFRKYLGNLESMRILSSRLSGKGQRGNTRLITVRAPPTELTALLGEMY